MKVLIYQVYIPRDPKDKHDKLIEESTSSFKAYADYYGMDYMFVTDPPFKVDEIPKDADWRMQFYWSMDLCKPELMHYDYIVHVDTDIIVKLTAPDIREELKGDFLAVREAIDLLDHFHTPIAALRRAFAHRNISDFYGFPWWNFFNSGVWAASPAARKLFWENWREDAFKTYEEPAPEFPFRLGNPYNGDQDILNNLIHNSDLEFNPLSWKWNAMSDALKHSSLKDAYAIHYCAKPGKFLYNNPEYRDKTPLSKEAIKLMEEQMQ